MVTRLGVNVVVALAATTSAAAASLYITPPWDVYATVVAVVGATASLLLIAVQLRTRRRP